MWPCSSMPRWVLRFMPLAPPSPGPLEPHVHSWCCAEFLLNISAHVDVACWRNPELTCTVLLGLLAGSWSSPARAPWRSGTTGRSRCCSWAWRQASSALCARGTPSPPRPVGLYTLPFAFGRAAVIVHVHPAWPNASSSTREGTPKAPCIGFLGDGCTPATLGMCCAGLTSPSRSPGSKLSVHAAEFKPHLLTDQHTRQLEAFRQWKQLYEEQVVPQLQMADMLMQQLDMVARGVWVCHNAVVSCHACLGDTLCWDLLGFVELQPAPTTLS